MKTNIGAVLATCGLAVWLSIGSARADEPDGLTLPPGFHAAVVDDGLVGMRHLAVRDNGDIYISTEEVRGAPSQGVIALHLDADGKVDRTAHFGDVDGGTGIHFYHGALYASSVTSVYRFDFIDDALTPAGPPQLIIDGMPTGGETNRIVAFDPKGGLYVAVGGSGNICVDPAHPKRGLNPCPGLNGRGGIWKFDAAKLNQKFPSGGHQIVTGLRDLDALDWRAGDGLYGVMHDRNGTSMTWPNLVSAADDDNIAEEMHRMSNGVNLGWPYTYYDGARKIRLTAPEYGGDGKTIVQTGVYDTPVLAFPGHSAPLDMVFYTGDQFPTAYRGGAFVAMHGGEGPATPGGHNGYDIVFVPFARPGRPGSPVVFADGFAGPTAASKNVSTAAYRPVGLALAPDGALYVADSQKGKLWRITYTGQ
jgi:glucose/arabinose dehydrogenase